jgi:chromosome segregation ATPase
LRREIDTHGSTQRDIESTRALLELIHAIPGHIESKEVALAAVLSFTDEALKSTSGSLHGKNAKLLKLSTRLGRQYKEVKLLKASLQHNALRMAKIEIALARLKREKFASSSKRLIDQLQLEEMEIAAGFDVAVLSDAIGGSDERDDDAVGEKRKPKRKALPTHLPRTTMTHNVLACVRFDSKTTCLDHAERGICP